MQYFISLLSDYFRNTDKWVLLIISAFVGSLIFINYRFGWENRIWNASSSGERFFRFYFLYLFAFAGAYFLQQLVRPNVPKLFWPFLVVVVVAPAIFALKISVYAHRSFFDKFFSYPTSRYLFTLLDYPIRFVFVIVLVYFFWRWIKPAYPFCGLTFRNFQLKPYLILLACMVPLIALASLRPDFLNSYPKMKVLGFLPIVHWYDRLFYEISYGIDFLTIETFFRGFLVLALAHFIGKDAILPMAAFYCVIHFGKPVPECISSYFGGLILGVLTFETQTIIGGLLVHVGIAWMMEAGGYFGNVIGRR
jgi:hypothetical protein